MKNTILLFTFFFSALSVSCADDTRFSIFDNNIDSECEFVNITSLYNLPESYSGKNICSEGRLLRTGANSFGFIPFEKEYAWDDGRMLLGVLEDNNRGLRVQILEHEGSIFSFDGVFSYNSDCWNAAGLETPIGSKGLLCAPHRKPMYIKLNALKKK